MKIRNKNRDIFRLTYIKKWTQERAQGGVYDLIVAQGDVYDLIVAQGDVCDLIVAQGDVYDLIVFCFLVYSLNALHDC